MARRPNRSNKKHNIPPTLIVGGIFFLLVSIVFVLFVNLKVDGIKKDLEATKKNKRDSLPKVVDLNIDEKLKIFLFDHEISKERLKLERSQKVEGGFFHRYKLLLYESENEALKPILISFLRSSGFTFQDYGNKLVFEHTNTIVEIEIDLIEEKAFKNHVADYDSEIKRDNSKQEKGSTEHRFRDKHRFVVILDDAGQNIELAKKVASMKYPIVMSILPYSKFDKETAELARNNKKEYLLHQPMEPKSYPDTNPGKGAILLNMPRSVIEATIKENITRLGGVSGVNNHMGSAFTENSEKMKETLEIIKSYTDIFVDSHTTPNTVAYDVCKSIDGLKCGQSKRFIDNMADYNYIKNKIYEAVRFLDKQDVIVIGHLRNMTVEVLEKVLPELEKNGVHISTISEVVK
ncbi:MAG: divergent polysaccharide deacetylase family protein [Calditerrivibrio sp.]|nr:divergent polysaccharide deacetylase family protein [Calditerrivibrio sp.]